MRTRSIGLVASVAVAVALTATSARAQVYNAAGNFNGWSGTADVLTEIVPGVHYQGTVTGLTPGNLEEYKITQDAWTFSWPGSNGKVAVNGAGEITFHFYPGAQADGWFPASDRVGYDDPQQHGWDIMGSFNGWSGPVVLLTDMGGGLYSGQTTVASPGTYEFKFRKDGDWAISIGDNFGNSAANNSVTTTVADEVIQFDLDLPNGRWLVGPPPAGSVTVPTMSTWGMSTLVLSLACGLVVWFGKRGVVAPA